ncbi:hypothetical protein [Salinactinospora qingdaonensis]|uniref:Extracellular solute-binding protein n=1 Tax=Salinactinospora qingdaonensis TaxID=702744 RepID=A0ABP7GGH4_9ACTN
MVVKVAERRSGLRLRRIVAVAVTVVLFLSIGIFVGWGLLQTRTTMVTGVIGSEKEPFFDDPRVRDRFAELGYTIEVSTAGSRTIATDIDLSEDDFAFPSSTPSAEELQKNEEVQEDRLYEPFFSPMVILSRTPVVESLAEAGLATQENNGSWTFDMSAYLELAGKGRRWRDMPGDFGGSNPNVVLVRTTDPRSSNSAAMYLVVTSYLLNGESIIDTQIDPKLVDRVSGLFLDQGNPPETSQQPFKQFVSLGASHTPLLWAYEAQYISAKVNEANFPDDIVLLYPSPTTFSTHTVVALNEKGAEVGRYLTDDSELQRLAVEHGLRPNGDGTAFTDFTEEKGLNVRPSIDSIVYTPTYNALDGMLNAIEKRYSDGGVPPASEDIDNAAVSPPHSPDRDDLEG